MPVIDSQVHAYAANTPDRPWVTVPDGWPDHVTGDEMAAAMDAVGVDGAIFVSAFSMYRFDSSYAESVQKAHPDRFAIVKPVDPADPSVADIIAQWKTVPGAVGIRLIMDPERGWDPDNPAVGLILREAAKHDMPVNLLCWRNLEVGAILLDAHPDTMFVLDHLALQQAKTPKGLADPWALLPRVLDLASRPNAVIKVSGACTLSLEDYPYPDIWDPLARVFDAWGLERCLWGTDWTRTFPVLTYEQGVAPFRLTDRLSDRDRGMLMGGACARVYGWEPRVR